MKYVIIADDIGNPIYFDHPDGRMICLPLATHHSVMSENFNESFKEMSCGNTKLVFQQYETLSFLLVSDQGEPPSALKSQLHIVYQLLLLLFGPSNLHGLGKRRFSFLKYQKNIQRLIDTTFQLCNDAQSVLVQSVEMLEVTEEHRKKCTVALKGVVTSLPESTHALLFVGTKLLAWYFRPKLFQLSSMDMFLLILFLRSTFHPTERTIVANELPVADYTDHDKIFQTSGESSLARVESTDDLDDGVSMDEDFETAPEWDEEQSFVDESIHSDATDPVVLLQCGLLDELFDESRVGQLAESISTTTDSVASSINFSFSLSHALQQDAARQLVEVLRSGLSQGKTGDAVAVLQFALHATGHFPDVPNDAEFGFSTAEAVQRFQKTHGMPETGIADVVTVGAILKDVRAPDIAARAQYESDGEEKEKVKPTKHTRRKPREVYGTPSASSSFTATPPGLSRCSSRDFTSPSPSPLTQSLSSSQQTASAASTPSPGPPRTPKAPLQRAPSLFQQLHMRAPGHTPMWVYFSEVQENTTLVIINKGLTGKDEEKEKLERATNQIRDWLYKNYAGYFIAKERAHLPILHHLHQLPGLVHYIFVDRTGNRVRAPTITPLHGLKHKDAETTQHMLDRVKEQVWQLVYTAHSHLAEGYMAMLVRKGDFLYSYRMWMEDDEGVEQIINQAILPKNYQPPVGHRFFKEILRTLFPSTSQAQQIKCYELFTLYLGILPTALVAKNDRALITLLLEKGED